MIGRVTKSLACVLLLCGSVVWAGEQPLPSAEEQYLRSAGLETDTPSLLAFFRDRTLQASDWDRMKQLVRQMGNDSFVAREKASAELLAIGAPALPLLNEATKDPDLEIARRSEDCVRQIYQKEPYANLALAAARILGQRRSPGAVEALLGFLPFADDDLVVSTIAGVLPRFLQAEREGVLELLSATGNPWLALAVASQIPRAEAPLTAALSNKVPVCRWVAAEALCASGRPAHVELARRLLRDASPVVRLRTACAFAGRKDKEAVPVLIDLLAQLPMLQAQQAEAILVQLAQDQAPNALSGVDEPSRRKWRDAWLAWWRAEGASADLDRLAGAPRLYGYSLLVLLDRGMAQELDADNKVRWQIEGLEFPLDAQVLPGDHLLVAENHAHRVTERNRRGQVVWEKKIDNPLMAQRLPNGNTFIATQYQFLEVDRTGREIFTQNAPANEYIMKAQRLPNGDIACVTSQSLAPQAGILPRFLRLKSLGDSDPKGFPVRLKHAGGRIDVLPNGNVLVPENQENRVVEYDPTGKPVWEAEVSQPVAAVRLPNGNTLVTSMNENRAIEFDRTGKQVVWDYKSDTRVTRALRR